MKKIKKGVYLNLHRNEEVLSREEKKSSDSLIRFFLKARHLGSCGGRGGMRGAVGEEN